MLKLVSNMFSLLVVDGLSFHVKVGAAVYALKDAKALPKEKIFSGKGTDASNNHDEEAEEEDFSDDEAVRKSWTYVLFMSLCVVGKLHLAYAPG